MRIEFEIVATVGQQKIPLQCDPLIVVVDTSEVRLSIDKCIVPLTSREIQVRDLMLEGKQHKEIGKALNISARTVKYHAGTLYAKYGVVDRQALVGKLSPINKITATRGQMVDKNR
jgi:DNA-binding NarL/FixJ family response regulator